MMTLREAATVIKELHIDQITNDRPTSNVLYTRLALEYAGRISVAYLLELEARERKEQA